MDIKNEIVDECTVCNSSEQEGFCSVCNCAVCSDCSSITSIGKLICIICTARVPKSPPTPLSFEVVQEDDVSISSDELESGQSSSQNIANNINTQIDIKSMEKNDTLIHAEPVIMETAEKLVVEVIVENENDDMQEKSEVQNPIFLESDISLNSSRKICETSKDEMETPKNKLIHFYNLFISHIQSKFQKFHADRGDSPPPFCCC